MPKVADLQAELSLKKDKYDKAMKDAGSAPNKLGSAFSDLGKGIASAFTVGALVAFTGKMVNITAEFQKFKAVLTTTFGSESIANDMMSMISKFASETPYAVSEITGAFVKLANQGFVPTKNELKKLGDLAASTGKTFDQLAEAIIDAGTGQFERLKEFGIKASANGDKVAFSFKGITTEVDNSSASIQDFILSLGDLEGVAGSMEGISQTLGGQISNLGDSYDQFLVALGNKSQGVFMSIFKSFGEMLSNMTMAIDSGEYLKEAGVTLGGFFAGKDALKSEAKALLDTQRSLIGASSEEIQKAIVSASKKMGFYSGATGDEFNKLYAYFIGNLTRMTLDADEMAKKAADLKKLLAGQTTAKEKEEAEKQIEIAKQMYQDLENLRLSQSDMSEIGNMGDNLFFDVSKGIVDLSAYDNLNIEPIKLDLDITKFNEKMKEAGETIKNFHESMRSMSEQFLADLISSVAESIGEAIGSGEGMQNLFSNILGMFGSFLKQMGSMMVLYGIAQLALFESWKLGPAGAITLIAAGAALGVLGGMMSGAASKMSNGGGSTSGMSGGGYGGGGGSEYGYGIGNNGGQLVAVVKGSDLEFILQRAGRNSGRIGM